MLTLATPMPRPPRLHVPGAFYHVTLRGNHRQQIFFSPADYRLLDSLVSRAISKCRARVHAYCWMPNHIHLLVQVSDVELGGVMMRVAGQYARIVQSHIPTTGHLFENRYHALLVETESYLLELLRYIHLNPVRARIESHPNDHAWSSHRIYTGQRVAPWVTTDFALAMFHSERRQATDAYARFVELHVGKEQASPLRDVNPNDGRILGSDEFLARALEASWHPRSHKTLDELIAEACAEFRVDRDMLVAPGKQRHLTKARAWIAHQAVRQRVASLSTVARELERSESTLREAVERHFPFYSRWSDSQDS